jgi:hypothetical protein
MKIRASIILLFCLVFPLCVSAQPPNRQDQLDYVLDMAQQGVPLPKIFYPCIDLSGRGFHTDIAWPQNMAAPAALDCWQKDIGFRGVYRLQFNLWEISQLDRNKALQGRLLANYDAIIKRISNSGGTVIVDFYSTPQGQGKVLDKTSSPVDLAAFKQQIKEHIRHFSCEKKYTVWYEVWNAPDLDNFFLGRKNEYLALYRCVAEAAKELQSETGCLIPVGGPSASWWFRSFDESTILTPERSLIYELIKFCYRNKLPLDFISWHAYSTDPQAERELTAYNKGSIALIRDWLMYFGFPQETPLVVDEWNFDNGVSNVLEERRSKGNIGASYLVSRLKNMYEADLTNQIFFSLEDFQENKEGVVRNVGAFWYEQSQAAYTGGSKSAYNAFRMLSRLENTLLPSQNKPADEFAGVIATRGISDFAVIAYDYADPEIFRSVISRSIALLNEAERRSVLAVMRSDKAQTIMSGATDIATMRLSGRVKELFRRAQALAASARLARETARQFRLTVKNFTAPYMLERYVIDDSCSLDCPFIPVETKEIVPDAEGQIRENIELKPYSVTLVVLKPAPPPPPPAQKEEPEPIAALVPPPPLVQDAMEQALSRQSAQMANPANMTQAVNATRSFAPPTAPERPQEGQH